MGRGVQRAPPSRQGRRGPTLGASPCWQRLTLWFLPCKRGPSGVPPRPQLPPAAPPAPWRPQSDGPVEPQDMVVERRQREASPLKRLDTPAVRGGDCDGCGVQPSGGGGAPQALPCTHRECDSPESAVHVARQRAALGLAVKLDLDGAGKGGRGNRPLEHGRRRESGTGKGRERLHCHHMRTHSFAARRTGLPASLSRSGQR
jgi:hypothetical protein